MNIKSPVSANLIKGMEAVGGKLYFTDTEMTFASHLINFQAGGESIPYSFIQSVAPRKTLGIVPNGISVTTKDGREFKFVVNGREEIMRFIKYKAGIN